MPEKWAKTIPAVASLCGSVLLLLGSAAAQAGPQTIQMRMTTDQVQASLGQPSKVVNLGAEADLRL